MTMRNDLVASGFLAITPSDTAFVRVLGLVCGVSGNVSVTDSLGVTTTVPMVAGQPLMGQIVRVNATLTTATGIVGFVP